MKLTKEDLPNISLPMSRETYYQLRDSQIPIRLWPKRLIEEYVRCQDEIITELWEESQLGIDEL